LQERTEEGVLILTLNRPEAMNCFNTELLAALAEVIREANFDTALAASSSPAPRGRTRKRPPFDRGRSEGAQRHVAGSGTPVRLYDPQHLHCIEQVRVPVIAAINGFAFGGGTELAWLATSGSAAANAIMGPPKRVSRSFLGLADPAGCLGSSASPRRRS